MRVWKGETKVLLYANLLAFVLVKGSRVSGLSLSDLDATCKKTLWLTGFQVRKMILRS
jgi:hypothetical protein